MKLDIGLLAAILYWAFPAAVIFVLARTVFRLNTFLKLRIAQLRAETAALEAADLRR
ncbi:hypothetical protein AB4089_08580 [Arthrobacter sp. 2MCAF15]|uniref:hypothetical protein n=1 Tax=Arthrobacter sp. 2MCAF15 TaxID=3232984 RepID=UPI003F8E7FBC